MENPAESLDIKPRQLRNTQKWLRGLLLFFVLSIFCFFVLYLIIIQNGKSILEQKIDKFETSETTLVYDQTGHEVAKLYSENGNRESVPIRDIPLLVKQAFIATEDQRFASHSGVDFWSIGRAIFVDISEQGFVQGGSTITQQLAKNVFLDTNKNFFRKATELSIALAIEKKYSKEEILEKYLNRIYFGSGAYGIKAASKIYFNQSDLAQLDIWQIATLAALPKAPSTYSPLTNPELSKERRLVVLQLMEEQGYITAELKSNAEKIDYMPPLGRSPKQYASYIDYVVDEAERMYGLSEEQLLTKGYRIITTLDKQVQGLIETTYDNPAFFQADAKDGEKIQSAMVILDNQTGAIIGMIGGRDYKSQSFNRVFSLRQPGSVIKPLVVYAPAIESGNWNPYSMLSNYEQTFGSGNQTYKPRNYDRSYSEEVTMMYAVKRSLNVPAVWLLNQIGVKQGYNFIKELGIHLDTGDRNLALALGGLTQGVSPLQMALAYSVFANAGYLNTPHVITKILDNQNKEVAVFSANSKKVISEKTAYYIRLMLEGVVKHDGTGRKAYFNRPLAGKTGTTGLSLKGLEMYDRDVWFVGFTPEWTAAVWEGFDKTDSLHFVNIGSDSTASIFKEVMSKALAQKEIKSFSIPKGVEPLQEPVPKVTNVKVSFDSTLQAIHVTWTHLNESYIYEVLRKSSKEEQYQKVDVVNLPEFYDSPIELNETYDYVVVAINPTTQSKSIPSDPAQILVLVESTPEPSPTPEDTTASSPLHEVSVSPEQHVNPPPALNSVPF